MYVCMYVCMYAIVSITGIEIFDSSGHLIKLSNPDMQVDSNVCMHGRMPILYQRVHYWPLLLQIWAHPADINILPEYGRDPRTVGE